MEDMMAGHGGNYTMVRRQGNCMMVRRQEMKSVVFVWVSWRKIKEMAVSYETFVKNSAGAPATTARPEIHRLIGAKRSLEAKLEREAPERGGRGEGRGER